MSLSATQAVLDVLNGQTIGVVVPCITITLRDGTVLRWARRKTNVAFDGTTWLAHGQGGRPLLLSGNFRRPVGLEEIGTATLRLGCGDSAVLGSRKFTLAASQGVLRGATFLWEWLVAATPSSAFAGKVWAFGGKVASSPSDSHGVTLNVEAYGARLKSIVLPKTVVSAPCGNALYDTACGLLKADYTSTSTVAAGSTRSVVNLSGSWADGYWDGGILAITSGALSGAKYGIHTSTGGQLTLSTPAFSAPVAGVTVSISRGCDRTEGLGGCHKFGNRARFRGMPHVPRES